MGWVACGWGPWGGWRFPCRGRARCAIELPPGGHARRRRARSSDDPCVRERGRERGGRETRHRCGLYACTKTRLAALAVSRSSSPSVGGPHAQLAGERGCGVARVRCAGQQRTVHGNHGANTANPPASGAATSCWCAVPWFAVPEVARALAGQPVSPCTRSQAANKHHRSTHSFPVSLCHS
jgi:hypothetical protein